MTNEELKNYLNKKLTNCEKERKRNMSINHGLGGDYLVTEKGKINDAFLRGKMEIIKAVIERLETPSEQEQATKKERAELMATDYIAYLEMLIKEKEQERQALDNELHELKAELNEKKGYRTLEQLGIEY